MKTLKEYIVDAEERGIAIGHFNISNLEILKGIFEAAKKLVASGVTDSDRIITAVRNVLQSAPLANIEYVEIVNNDNMTSLVDVSKGALLALAVCFGNTRLIDNIIIPTQHKDA